MSAFIDDAIKFYSDILNIPNLFENVEYQEFDEFDFFNKVKEITGDESFSEFMVISVPNNEKYSFIIKDKVALEKNNFGLEVFYSQLSNLILKDNEKIKIMSKRFNNKIFRNAHNGLLGYLSFYTTYLSQYVMSYKYKDTEENPYSEEKSKLVGVDILKKAVNSAEISSDEKMSMIFYAFSKFVTYDDGFDEIYDLRTFIELDVINESIQELYSIFASTKLEDITIWHLLKINKLINKIHNFLEKK